MRDGWTPRLGSIMREGSEKGDPSTALSVARRQKEGLPSGYGEGPRPRHGRATAAQCARRDVPRRDAGGIAAGACSPVLAAPPGPPALPLPLPRTGVRGRNASMPHTRLPPGPSGWVPGGGASGAPQFLPPWLGPPPSPPLTAPHTHGSTPAQITHDRPRRSRSHRGGTYSGDGEERDTEVRGCAHNRGASPAPVPLPAACPCPCIAATLAVQTPCARAWAPPIGAATLRGHSFA